MNAAVRQSLAESVVLCQRVRAKTAAILRINNMNMAVSAQ
jgi:hypothetical protein